MPLASRYAFNRESDHAWTALSNASSAFSLASSVARAHSLPAFEVAAPRMFVAVDASLSSFARCLRASAMSSFRLEPCGTLMLCSSRNRLSSESDHALKRASLRVAWAAAAEADADEAAFFAAMLARRAWRRTAAISRSRVVGWGMGHPRSSSHSFKSESDHCS